MLQTAGFESFFMAGFECACQRTFLGRRLNVTASSGHDRHALADYRRARALGMLVARDGLQWPLVEPSPGRYDFSSVLPLVAAARTTGVQVVWDLCHFGWPDDLDVFSPEFPERLAGLAGAFAGLLREESDDVPYLTPVNEPSYFSWAAGEVGYIHPRARRRGAELKRQLVRATIAAIDAVREVAPGARFVSTDPAIVVHPHPDHPEQRRAAETFHEQQFEARDMLSGRVEPQLGGTPDHLDIVGVCYFPFNQWCHGGSLHENVALAPDDDRRVPLRQILRDLHERYRRPLFIAETSAESQDRRSWLRQVADETRAALQAGVPVEGICWYPVLNHPGWDDDRHVEHGVWELPRADGSRAEYAPLVAELAVQERRLAAMGIAPRQDAPVSAERPAQVAAPALTASG